MSTIREWVSFFYADISAQLRRHCVNQHMFYGLYLNNNTITGAWLFQELASKYSVFGEEREAMYVIVIKGGSETETWSLRWYSLTLNQIELYHSMSNFPGARVVDGLLVRDLIIV